MIEVKNQKIYSCKYCNATTDEDLDSLIGQDEKMYLNGKRIGWSAFNNGGIKVYCCLNCRNTVKVGIIGGDE